MLYIANFLSSKYCVYQFNEKEKNLNVTSDNLFKQIENNYCYTDSESKVTLFYGFYFKFIYKKVL